MGSDGEGNKGGHKSQFDRQETQQMSGGSEWTKEVTLMEGSSLSPCLS